MRIAITGPDGFVGWHTRCALRARGADDPVLIGREHFSEPDRMAKLLVDADAVVHLAGVNRASSEESVKTANPWLARQLVAALELLDRPMPVVYGNSIHADGDGAFGAAKRDAGRELASYGERRGAPVADVLLPNLFGEASRPFYNSVVATFSHQLARGETPVIDVDHEIPLLHVQRAVALLLDLVAGRATGEHRPFGHPLPVSEILGRLSRISSDYRCGDLPDLSDDFTRDLFNTYRSFTFPDQWPIRPSVHRDERGELVETVRAAGGQAQVFVSRTRPGATRGRHFHLHKVERFVVLRGSAVIRLRRLLTRPVFEFRVSGDRPAVIDMPTMHVHSLTNTGASDLTTLFYADRVFDAKAADTYPEEV